VPPAPLGAAPSSRSACPGSGPLVKLTRTAPIEIASSMAGRAIVRKPALAFLSTTSLYGGSSQYNRISIPCDRVGGRQGEAIRYVERGRSEAYGTSQFSDATVLALTDLVQQSEGGIRVNSIFGEGQSPKLRKIREGLEALQFPADRMLQHGRGRVVYCIPLIRNLRDFLLGIDPKPEYLAPLDVEVTARIADWWKERWFRHRTESPDVMTQVEKHTKVYPISHGARVSLPQQITERDRLPEIAIGDERQAGNGSTAAWTAASIAVTSVSCWRWKAKILSRMAWGACTHGCRRGWAPATLAKARRLKVLATWTRIQRGSFWAFFQRRARAWKWWLQATRFSATWKRAVRRRRLARGTHRPSA